MNFETLRKFWQAKKVMQTQNHNDPTVFFQSSSEEVPIFCSRYHKAIVASFNAPGLLFVVVNQLMHPNDRCTLTLLLVASSHCLSSMRKS